MNEPFHYIQLDITHLHYNDTLKTKVILGKRLDNFEIFLRTINPYPILPNKLSENFKADSKNADNAISNFFFLGGGYRRQHLFIGQRRFKIRLHLLCSLILIYTVHKR